ncbi:hypothetical protein Tco_1126263 [Tanacetum coccineum]
MEDNNTTKGMTEDNGNSSKTKRNRASPKPFSVVKTFLEACLHELAFDRREGSGLKTLSWKRVAKKNKHVESLKTTRLPFPELCVPLFDGTLSSGVKSHGPSSTEPRRVVEPHMVEDDEHIEVVNVESPTPPWSSHAPRPPVKTKKRGKQLMDGVEEGILGV